jgi:hypothetical protein
MKLTKDHKVSGMAGNYIDDVFTTQSSILMDNGFILSYDWLKIGVSKPNIDYEEFDLSVGSESYQLLICDNILIDLNENKSDDLHIDYYYSLRNMNRRRKNAYGKNSNQKASYI